MDLSIVLLIVAGVVAPGLNALLKQPAWSSKRSWLVSLASAAGLSGVAQWISGDFTAEQVAQGAMAAWTVSQAIYQLVFKRSQLNKKLEATLVRGSDDEGGL